MRDADLYCAFCAGFLFAAISMMGWLHLTGGI